MCVCVCVCVCYTICFIYIYIYIYVCVERERERARERETRERESNIILEKENIIAVVVHTIMGVATLSRPLKGNELYFGRYGAVFP